MAATDVEGAIDELATEKLNKLGTVAGDEAGVGEIEEYFASRIADVVAYVSLTVTITLASPGVFTSPAHGFAVGPMTTAVVFSTTGALPTGIVAGTTYYLKAIDVDTFNIATTAANALAGTFINTSGSQSGTHTVNNRINLVTGANQALAAIRLPAGDWMVHGFAGYVTSGTTSVVNVIGSLSLSPTVRSDISGYINSQTYANGGELISSSFFPAFNMGPARFKLAADTNVYVLGASAFSASTMLAFGYVKAWRRR